MLFTRHREIEVKEYTLNSICTKGRRKKIANSHLPLNLTGWRLSHAVARTICSQNLDNKDYWFDFISTLFGLSNIIDSSRPNIRIKAIKINLLRDFSRTGKIGEMSQGIMWLYMLENGYPYISDFHFFCTQNRIAIPHKTSTPDFVGQDIFLSNKLCLAESKGKEEKSTGSVKGKLSDALSQCNTGENILNTGGLKTHKKLGFCTEWADNTSANNSILHFVDPENNFEERKLKKNPMNFHYAAWFYMIGDFENCDRLIAGESIILKKSNFEIETRENDSFWIFSNTNILDDIAESSSENIYLKRSLSRILFRDGKYGISKSVVDMLQNNGEKEFKSFNNLSNDEYELFADGTIILKR